METFIFYTFFVTGTASFLAELLWRVTHWKVKNKDIVVNCTVQSKETDGNKVAMSIADAIKKQGLNI